MATRIGWGIIGTGRIAGDFAEDLRRAPGAVLAAVGSRTEEAAEAFGRRFRVPHRHASYAALVEDPSVDVVYVATPHSRHAECSTLALRAGKAVLCEKPLTINAREALGLVELARARGLFLMEAMWTRYLPAAIQLRELLAEGVLGEIRLLTADFGLRFEFDPHGRLFAPELGGGALLDLGVYPISLASMVLGQPEAIVSLAKLGETGVDESAGMVLGYAQGRIACLYTTTRAATPSEATIIGTKGRICLHAPIYRPERMTLTLPGRRDQRMERRVEGNGLHYEAVEVMRCLAEGRLESSLMPLEESLSITQTMDALRAQWGLVYPGE